MVFLGGTLQIEGFDLLIGIVQGGIVAALIEPWTLTSLCFLPALRCLLVMA